MDLSEFKKRYERVEVSEITNNVTKSPLVSVCVQTYQHSLYIKETLDGILEQKASFDYEIIIGDDASTDGTRELCMAYADAHKDKIRLFLHHRENNIKIAGKPSGRFNVMYNLFQARGKYIALCEGDDYWTDPLKLKRQVDFLEAHPNYSLCFHNALVDNDGVRFPMFSSIPKETFFTEDVINNWFVPTASIVFRNYEDLEFPEWSYLTLSGDLLLLLLLSLYGPFKYLNEEYSVYRKHSAGISNTHIELKKVASMVTLFNGFNQLTDYKYNEVIEKAITKEIQIHLPAYRELKRIKNQKIEELEELNKELLNSKPYKIGRKITDVLKVFKF